MAKGKGGITRRAEGDNIPEYGSKRIHYSDYMNGGYSRSEAIPNSYDKETKTIEVRTYPRLEKAFEMIPDSAVTEWAKALYTSPNEKHPENRKAYRRKALFEIYYAYRDDIKDGAKIVGSAKEWEKKLYKYIKKTIKKYGWA